jgi:hypothetical protein
MVTVQGQVKGYFLLIVFADDSVSVFHKTNFVTESLD